MGENRPDTRRVAKPLRCVSQTALDNAAAVAYLARRPEAGHAITSASHDIELLTGYPAETVTGAPDFWAAHVHPDDLLPALTHFATLDEADREALEYRFRAPDGRFRILREDARLVPGAPGREAVILGALTRLDAGDPVRPATRDPAGINRQERTAVVLRRLLDSDQIQSMMHDFQQLTGAVFAIVDPAGTVLVASGWRDICTRFHRAHPESARHCTESDLYLAGHPRRGEYVAYRCRNLLWDVVTPLFIGADHVANIYTGQFLYDDEPVDRDAFIRQADRYGYDRQAYLEALDWVPRLSRERIAVLMDFLVKFTLLLSELGTRNLRLENTVAISRRVTGALRESERHFRQLATQAPIPIAIFDATGATETLNDRFVSTFGYTPQTLPSLAAWWHMAFLDAGERRAAEQAWTRAMDEPDTPAQEQRIVAADGTVRVVETLCSRIGDKSLAILTDITQRKRAEEDLQASEERLQNLYSLSPVGIFLCTPDGRYLSANQALADLLGHATADDLVQSVDSLPNRTFHDPGEWTDIVSTLETEGKFVNRLVKRHKKDGTPIWVLMNMRAVRGSGQAISHFEGFTLDITERMRAAEALRDSEERLRTLINAMPDLVCFKDGHGRWLEANSFARRLFRLTPADYQGRTDRDLAQLFPFFRATFIENAIADDLAWHAARMYRGEQAILDTDGIPLVFDIIKVPLFHDDGSRRGLVTVGRDITKQREASAALAQFNRKLESLVTDRTTELEAKAAELQAANARLLELDAVKSAFVSSVSHEVRTPLTSILGFTRLIERDFSKHFLPLGQDRPGLAPKGERIMANLRVIDHEGDRLKRLINDFLDLAKIEYGSLRWQDAWVAPGALCRQVAEAMAGMLSDRPELAFALDLAPGLPRLWIDADRLQQVLLNLVGNAVKFTPAGTITLRVRPGVGRQLRLAVSDTGIGIRAEDIERIFEKFHQAGHDANADRPRGTGLGLTICRQIVQHYGGAIWAESTPGQGSTFHITLPLGEEPR